MKKMMKELRILSITTYLYDSDIILNWNDIRTKFGYTELSEMPERKERARIEKVVYKKAI